MTVKARKEVILSAGTIGTTQILQLSGIGNADDLKALDIPVLIDNPAVGANLIDHVLLPNIFNVKGDESLDRFFRDPSLLGAAIDQWAANRTGLVANSITNTLGFARLPSNSPIFKTIPDPASGPKSPHWEMIFIVSSLYLVRVLLWPVLIFHTGFLDQSRHCPTSYRKFLDFTHCPH
jgi:choline dehydrogenase